MIEHKILISEEKLDKRIRELAKQISEDYKGEDITLICTLKGAVYFTIDLSKKITDSDVILDFIRVSSYGINNRETTGKLDFKLDISEDIGNKNVIIVEDIIDSGITLSYLYDYLKTKNPKSLKICVLLDKKARATMVYYTLLNLHMFSDGNGRTSRFMYDLISGDLNEDNISYYFHKSSNNTTNQNNDLEKNKGILDIFIANQIPDELISSQLGFVPQEILKNYSWITVGHTNTSPSTETIIPKSSLENLTQKELQDLDKILHDSYGMKLCPSGLAMLYVSNKKGQLSKWIDINKNHISSIKGLERRFNFSIYKHPEMIADWTPDDFREVINVGNAVKYARLKTLIDVIAQPEKYINPDSGNTYCDDILGISKAKEVGRVDR